MAKDKGRTQYEKWKDRGRIQYEKWVDGQVLSPLQSIIAQCYICNGEEEGTMDYGCGVSCPLYSHNPHNRKKIRKTLTQKQHEAACKRLEGARAKK